jgi:RHS repeat-associated protein
MQLAGQSYQSSNYLESKYLYNGKELQSNLGLEWYDYGDRFYDPQLGRFHVVDRFAEKYSFMSPYQYAVNNPILFIDVNGDSINFSNVIANDKKLAQNTLNDLASKTGLDLSFDENGNLFYNKDSKVNKDGTSRRARKELMKGIDNAETVTVNADPEGDNFIEKVGDNVLFIGAKETEMLMQKAEEGGLNKTTEGYALTFLHEFGHTKVGGSRTDPSRDANPFDPGQNESVINVMRRQLGSEYGQRLSYRPLDHRYGTAIPYDRQAVRQIKKGQVITGKYLSIQKYTPYSE